MTTLPGPPEWQLPGNPCKKCGRRIISLNDHLEHQCPNRPEGGVCMVVLPPDVNDLYMVGVVGEEPPF